MGALQLGGLQNGRVAQVWAWPHVHWLYMGGGAKETEPQAAESCPARKFQTALAHQNYSETKNKNVLTSGPLNMNLLGRDLGTCVSKSLCRWL